MKFWKLAGLTGLAWGGECPSPCQCWEPTKPICAMAGLTGFPDISRSPDIEEFILLGNNITSLPQLANQLPRLKQINLSSNRLTSISRGSLPGSIETAWLDDNLVETISRRVFSNLSNLKRISLQQNKISVIERGSFLGLPSLIELKLANNQLTKIPRLTDSPSLELLDLSNNRLSEVDGSLLDLPRLTHLYLQGNSLLSITRIKLPSLLQLNVAQNRLSEMDRTVLDSEQLNTVDMSGNPLQQLPEDIFERLSELKTLNLRGTKITNIPVIPDTIKFNDLNLLEVPIDCGCSSAWLIQYASEMRSLDHLNDAVCQTPVALTGVRLGEATIADECNVKYVDDAQDDVCASFACHHGGKCVVEKKEPKCECYQAWGGEHCEELILAPVTTVAEEEQKIWILDVLTNTAQVAFTKAQGTKLKLYTLKDGEYRPERFVKAAEISGDTYLFDDLVSGTDYKVCHVSMLTEPCVLFSTLQESYSSHLADYTVLPPGEDALPASTLGLAETIGGICGAVILLAIMCVAVLFIRKRWQYEGALKSANSNSSGCEETNTWKYSSGGTDRSDNLTPNSYYSHSGDSYANAYPDVTQKIQYHYQPPASTPTSSKPHNNRHSAIIDRQQFHFRSGSTPPIHTVGGPHHQQLHHQHQQQQQNQHFYSHSFGTHPRDQTYQI